MIIEGKDKNHITFITSFISKSSFVDLFIFWGSFFNLFERIFLLLQTVNRVIKPYIKGKFNIIWKR